MAKVFIPTLLKELTGGQTEVQADGSTVRQIIQDLDRQFPGIGARLTDGGRLQPNISVAIDGEVTPLGLVEKVPLNAEVHFVTAIKGG
ncbi:MAG: MoaD/ThiS family protein [Bryobacterales bacterium]|nr:MoaD/ThiS family protein [Bryobacterales bacterium]